MGVILVEYWSNIDLAVINCFGTCSRSARPLERERESSVFVYRNKQTSAKTRWVSYIVVHYWLHPSCWGELLGSFRIRCGWWRWSSWVFCGLAGYGGDVLELEHVSKFCLIWFVLGEGLGICLYKVCEGSICAVGWWLGWRGMAVLCEGIRFFQEGCHGLYAILDQAIIMHKTLQKMQRMSVRDLDKMNSFLEKKERGFQIHSFERNNDNLATLRLVDRLARRIPQPARKEGYMPFHPFHWKLQSHMLCSSNG